MILLAFRFSSSYILEFFFQHHGKSLGSFTEAPMFRYAFKLFYYECFLIVSIKLTLMLLLASGSRWEENKFMVSYVFIEKLNIDLHSVKIGCVFACY